MSDWLLVIVPVSMALTMFGGGIILCQINLSLRRRFARKVFKAITDAAPNEWATMPEILNQYGGINASIDNNDVTEEVWRLCVEGFVHWRIENNRKVYRSALSGRATDK